MAAEDEELELDVSQPKSNKMTTILLIVLIVLVLILGGVGAWLYLSKGNGSASNDGEASSGDGNTENALKPVHYLSMVPEFVVNFGSGSKVHYLQVDLQVSTRNEAALAVINTYRPVLRNDILVLLSGQTYDELRERSGKEALQKKILNTVNKVVTEAIHTEKNKENKKAGDEQQTEIGDVKGPIENVYFTSFIMQ